MAISKKIDDFDRQASAMGKIIHRHTIQFLEKGGKYGHQPYGSGVLVFLNNKCLIFTAAHVTENFDTTPLFVLSNKGIIPIVGYVRETDLDKDNQTDLAYIILEDAIAAILVQSYDFIPLNRLLHSHIPEHINQYLVVGYPERNIRAVPDEKRIYTGSSIFILTMSKENVYDHYRFDKDKTYILDFAGKGLDLESNGESEKIGDPHGISGCGLWLLSQKQNVDYFELEYHLIGIMTEFRKGKYHCLVGNRIEIIISALTQLDGYNIPF